MDFHKPTFTTALAHVITMARPVQWCYRSSKWQVFDRSCQNIFRWISVCSSSNFLLNGQNVQWIWGWLSFSPSKPCGSVTLDAPMGRPKMSDWSDCDPSSWYSLQGFVVLCTASCGAVSPPFAEAHSGDRRRPSRGSKVSSNKTHGGRKQRTSF